jgi:hypothetical protein
MYVWPLRRFCAAADVAPPRWSLVEGSRRGHHMAGAPSFAEAQIKLTCFHANVYEPAEARGCRNHES